MAADTLAFAFNFEVVMVMLTLPKCIRVEALVAVVIYGRCNVVYALNAIVVSPCDPCLIFIV